MATIFVNTNEPTAARRRVYFYCVDSSDGITPETGEAGGQPQCSLDGEAYTNTGIGTLTALGNGDYSADLTQTKVNVNSGIVKTRYKSANTAETKGDTVYIGLATTTDLIAAMPVAGIRKNTTYPYFKFPMFLSGTQTPATGKTVTAQRIIDNASAASMANSAAEIGTTGYYQIDLDAADNNGDDVVYLFTAAGCDPTIFKFKTTS